MRSIGCALLLTAGCAATAPVVVAPSAVAASAPVASPAAAPSPSAAPDPSHGARAGLREVNQLLLAQKFDEASALLTELRAHADGDWLSAVVYAQATVCAERADYDCMRRLFTEHIAVVQQAHDYGAEAMLHNALTWTEWARGNYAAALDENEASHRVIQAAPVPDAAKLAVDLHYWWDRAYLNIDIAVDDHDAQARKRAVAARTMFKKLATRPDDADSVAVLDAYFYARTSDGPRALAAAHKVNLDRDRDVQDWYCVEVALAAGGETAAAAQLAARIRAFDYDYPMKSLIVRLLDKDARK